MKKLHILLSFTATLDESQADHLTNEGLDNAIFCFECARKWAIETHPEMIIHHQKKHEDYRDITPETIEWVRSAILFAEVDERVVWRHGRKPTEFVPGLNLMLQKVGLNPIRGDWSDKPDLARDTGLLALAILGANRKSWIPFVILPRAKPCPPAVRELFRKLWH